MKIQFTEQEMKNFQSFLIETCEFTKEQIKAIDCQIQMTQDIYDSILNRCTEIGHKADHLFFRMLEEYPELLSKYAQKIQEEVNK